MKNKRNLDLNVKATPLVHVKVKIKQGHCLGSGLGLGLNVEREDQIIYKELIKQTLAILALGLDVRTKIIFQIYVKRYRKYMCFHWFEHYAKGNF